MNKIKLSYKDSFLVDSKLFQEQARRLDSYMIHLRSVVSSADYNAKEASLNLANDKSICDKVLQIANEISSSKLKYIIVIGIGGSNLGAMAVYNALGRNLHVYNSNQPKILFLDTNNSKQIVNTIELLKKEVFSLEEVVVNIVSKSGSTTETLVNFEIIFKALLDQLKCDKKELAKRVVATTDEDSKLWKKAEENNFKKIAVPKQVGGRYSVLSPIGLLPLVLANIDIKEFQLGAKEILEQFLLNNNEMNPALISAISLYLHSVSGKNIVNNFIFNTELEAFGKWYSQLIGESVGKEYDRDGKIVNVGITPVVSIGSTDLHSVGQLFLGGPRDKFTFFIHSLENTGITVPKDLVSGDINSVIANKDLHEIMRAILDGTEAAYKKQKLPFIDISLTDISPYSIGALMQLKMVEIMLLAELFNVDAFDQPNVEAYKIETKKILI